MADPIAIAGIEHGTTTVAIERQIECVEGVGQGMILTGGIEDTEMVRGIQTGTGTWAAEIEMVTRMMTVEIAEIPGCASAPVSVMCAIVGTWPAQTNDPARKWGGDDSCLTKRTQEVTAVRAALIPGCHDTKNRLPEGARVIETEIVRGGALLAHPRGSARDR